MPSYVIPVESNLNRRNSSAAGIKPVPHELSSYAMAAIEVVTSSICQACARTGEVCHRIQWRANRQSEMRIQLRIIVAPFL
jgi:hypothetical protein